MLLKHKIIVSLLLLTVLSTSLFAQGFGEMDILDVDSRASVDKVQPGMLFNVAVIVNIHKPFHINAHIPSEEYLIPTEVQFTPQQNISFGKTIYPDPAMLTFPFSDEPLAVYEHKIIIFTEIQLSDQHPLGMLELAGVLNYQACNEENCFAPSQQPFTLKLDVVDSNEPVNQINEDIFSQMPSVQPASESSDASFTSDELRAKQVLEKGLPYALIAFFVFGLALNLTPCVYPVIPLTVGYFGGQSGKSKGSAFMMALAYVIGIAVVFALLGLISGLAGKQWGFLFQNTWFVIAIAMVILAMAASMFGAFEITVPAWLMGSLGKSREGNVGALVMGLTVGVVIAPCAAGIIIGLVGLVAKLGIVAKGTLLFFVMGLGLGLPYLILATFSGLLSKIPQSGMWMVWVRKFFGILLIGVAIYFLLPQAKHIYNQQGFFFGVLALFGGLLLGFLDHSSGYTRNFKIGRAIFGILLMLWGIVMTNGAIHSEPPAIRWVHYDGQSLAELQSNKTPVIIDFYADWCAPCKQMDRETFVDDVIVEKAKSFTMIKVDCTSPDKNTRTFMQTFNITGMPTFVFLTSAGNELSELREIGYVDAPKFQQKMETLLAAE
ncbi:thioredoxin fold domain-containing protein [candidate division KSB1 bacterium]|nr:thioredoxin fold domain-containing protein [candidate division KSB1 bacterium]